MLSYLCTFKCTVCTVSRKYLEVAWDFNSVSDNVLGNSDC